MEFKLLKGDQVAELLNISRSQAYGMMKRGEIPSVKFGKCVRVRKEDLDNFIAGHCEIPVHKLSNR